MRPLVAHLSAAALQHNYTFLSKCLGGGKNGYGLRGRRRATFAGLGLCCRLLEEVISLREAGITQPILLLEAPLSGMRSN